MKAIFFCCGLIGWTDEYFFLNYSQSNIRTKTNNLNLLRSSHSVKPAVFDLILTLAIVAYLSVVYFAIQLFPRFYEEYAKLVTGKAKVHQLSQLWCDECEKTVKIISQPIFEPIGNSIRSKAGRLVSFLYAKVTGRPIFNLITNTIRLKTSRLISFVDVKVPDRAVFNLISLAVKLKIYRSGSLNYVVLVKCIGDTRQMQFVWFLCSKKAIKL